MYLVDTNIWLELLLKQENYDSAYEFLSKTDSSLLNITDFSFYSIGIILTRLKKTRLFKKLVKDVLINSGVKVIHLLPEDMGEIIKIVNKFNLDFDDAYHYVAADKYDLILVSFDSDFDKTKKGRMIPKDALDK